MTDREKAMLRGILFAAKIPIRDHDWMIESCPDFESAREHYSRSYKPIASVNVPPSDYYVGILAARNRVIAAQRDVNELALMEAKSMLTTEIAVFQHRLESESKTSEAKT